MAQRIFKYVVELPYDKGTKDICEWLLDNIGPPGEDWSINVNMEVAEFFGYKVNSREPGRLIEIFNIGFKSEEDKVKFILYFL